MRMNGNKERDSGRRVERSGRGRLSDGKGVEERASEGSDKSNKTKEI